MKTSQAGAREALIELRQRVAGKDAYWQAKIAINFCDAHLSAAQGAIGEYLANAETKESSPRLHGKASRAFDLIERARRLLDEAIR